MPESESRDAIGKALSDREIAREFAADLAAAMRLANWTPQAASIELAYANQSPISKLLNPEQAPALAKLLTLRGMRAAWIEVLADRCPEFVREVTLKRRRA